jgi:hypothetical protein
MGRILSVGRGPAARRVVEEFRSLLGMSPGRADELHSLGGLDALARESQRAVDHRVARCREGGARWAQIGAQLGGLTRVVSREYRHIDS